MHIQIISFLETKTLNLKEMLGNLSQMYPPGGDGPDILSLMQSNLSGLSIGWQVQTQEDGTYYYLNAALPNGSGGSWLIGHN